MGRRAPVELAESAVAQQQGHPDVESWKAQSMQSAWEEVSLEEVAVRPRPASTRESKVGYLPQKGLTRSEADEQTHPQLEGAA
jgi:hypothetical protein